MADYISQFTGGEIDRRLAKVSELEAGKQDKLVSGETIKTVGGQSVLGAGDIPMTDQEAVKFTPQTLTDAQKAQALANIGAASEDEVAALADQKYEGPYATTDALPTASASTMGAIYLVGPDSNGEYDRYVTKVDGSTYTWRSLGKTSIDLANYATKEEVSQLQQEVTDLNNTRYEEENIDISSRQQFILGYATKQGVFTDIGTGSVGLRYIPVESGKTYRMTGKYTGNATGKANLMFSANMPANDGVAEVITSERGVNEDFDVTYTPESNGYICLYVASIDYCGNFFAYSKELITDSLKEKDEELESSISEKTTSSVAFSYLTGYVNNKGIGKNIGGSVNYGFNYIQVVKGRKYTISGTFSNNAGTYAGIVFSETLLATGDVAVIVDMGTAGGTINYTYIPQLDGYLYAFSSNATFTEEVPEEKYLQKDSIFSFCKQTPLKLVGVADSKKYVTTSDNKITEGTADRTFMIQVLAGEKYLVRGRTHAYSQYAVIAFAQSNAVGTVAQIILSVNSEQLDYDFNQVVSIPANGYLIVWSSVRVYGSSNYTEILPLLDRITIDNDYYLPESFKLQTFGDSITDSSWGDSSSWVSYVPDNIPIQGLTIVNSGIGGYTYTGLRNLMENGGENSGGGVAPALQADADLVTIFLGTNDWSSGLTIDAVKTNIRNALDYLFATCKAKVLVMTPLQRYTSADAQRETDENGIPLNSAGYTLRELCDMIVGVCGMYSVPVLDLNAVALINKFNIMDYSEDGLHPNRWGDIQVSRLICKKIKEMLRG